MIEAERLDSIDTRLARIEALLRARTVERVVPLSVRAIVEDAAEILGIDVNDITGESTRREVAFARFAVAYVGRAVFGYSSARIGRALGGRDHTTILSGQKRAKQLIHTNGEFSGLCELLRSYAEARAEAADPDCRNEDSPPTQHERLL